MGDYGPSNIRYENYKDHYFFLVFNFGHAENTSDHFKEKKLGNVNLTLKFAANQNPAMKLLLYAEFENKIEIDQMRNITRDYQL